MLRDIHGIIVQPEGYKDAEHKIHDDGGDSAFSTGLNAWAGSKLDHELMPLFIKDGKLVRHPYQDFDTGTHPHNDPRATSRDQVLAFFSGLQSGFPMNEKVQEACLNYAKGWRVNRDILSPANKAYLYMCAGYEVPFLLKPFSHVNKSLELYTNTKINPNHEMNQSVVINSTFGEKYLRKLYTDHPNLFNNLIEYFGGWRGRLEIAENMIARIKRDLKL